MDLVMEEFKIAFGYSKAQMKSFKEELEKELESHSNFSLNRD